MHYISYISTVEPVSCLSPLISIRTISVRYQHLALWKLRPPPWNVPPNASVNRPAVDLVLPTKAEAQNTWSHPIKIPHRYVKKQALHEPKNAILIILPQPEPPTNDEKVASATESFRPLARELERLDEKDPILAAQAARLVALYRRLWESYVARNAESQRLDKENQQLKNANASLSEEKQQAERCSLEYDVLLSYYKEAHQKIEEGIVEVLENWKKPLVDSAGAGKQKQDGL